MARLHPNDVLNRLTDIASAWYSLRAAKSFGGLNLDDYRNRIQPSIDVRAEIASLRAQLKAALARRAVVDKSSLKTTQCIIYSVIGDPEEGEDGALYAAMGFVRKSERRSGLRRKRGQRMG